MIVWDLRKKSYATTYDMAPLQNYCRNIEWQNELIIIYRQHRKYNNRALGKIATRPVCTILIIEYFPKMLSIGPKMDGGPNTKYFESQETLNALEGVKNWLQKNAKKVKNQCQ